MKNLIIVKPGTLKAADKQKLTRAGNIVIEHPEPHIGVVQKQIDASNDYYVFVNCASCGDRIYMLSERLAALKKAKRSFYCNRGDTNQFT